MSPTTNSIPVCVQVVYWKFSVKVSQSAVFSHTICHQYSVLWSAVIMGHTDWRDGSTKYATFTTSTKDVVLVSVTHHSNYFHFQPRKEVHMPEKCGSSRSTDRTKHTGKSGCQSLMIECAQTTSRTKSPVTNIPIQRKIWATPHVKVLKAGGR